MKKVIEHVPDQFQRDDDISFKRFWAEYPKDRRVARKKAEQVFEKLPADKKSAAILGVITHRDHNPQWREPKYIPHPTTFLNQERWKDAIARDIKQKIEDEALDSPHQFVWAAMTQFYGQKWIKEHGEHPPELWRKMLAEIEPHRIKRGVRKVFESGSDYVPSLPKFMEYCARTFGEECERNEQRLKDAKQLPNPAAVDFPCESSEDAFNQVFEILGVKRND